VRIVKSSVHLLRIAVSNIEGSMKRSPIMAISALTPSPV
jgi:hypothetical protein